MSVIFLFILNFILFYFFDKQEGGGAAFVTNLLERGLIGTLITRNVGLSLVIVTEMSQTSP